MVSPLKPADIPDQLHLAANFFCNHRTQNVLGDKMHFLLSCSKFAVQRKALFDDLEVLGNIRNDKDFKTFFTVMNYGHGDIQVAHKTCKFVTDCFSLQPG